MWMLSNGSCSAPSIMSTIACASPMRAPQRAPCAMYGARLMLSAPPPTAMSVSPSMMVCAADTIACRPEPHSRFSVSAGVSCAHAGLHRGDAREVHVLRLGVDHVAEHHLPDVLAVDLGARQRLAHDLRAEIGGRHVLQAAAEIADGGAHAADDDDFTGHGSRVFRSCRR